MGVINAVDLKPGMVLAEDLFGANQRFLLPKGTVIEESHLRIFKIWGVSEAEVQGVDRDQAMAEALAEMDPRVLQRAEELADQLFIRVGLGQEAMQELHRLFILRTTRSILAKEDMPKPAPPESMESGDPKDLFQDIPLPGDLVDHHLKLASYPAIYQRLMEVLDHPRSTSAHLAEVLGKDPGLSAKLLKLVNSPYYGFPSTIDTIQRAVTLIGINELTTLALGVSVIESFGSVPCELVDMESCWKHSIACGLLASFLAARKPGVSEERFFVAGLLHDIGRLVLFARLPEQMVWLIRRAWEDHVALEELEKQYLGFDHASLAGMLLNAWNLPDSLVRMIRFHHCPEQSPNPLEASVVHIADTTSVALCFGQSGTRLVPPISSPAWNTLGLSPAALGQAASQVERHFKEVARTFFSPA
ncbi:MAG: HDOD domain-containing protein [Desulfovibrio sp.]|nr:MAG: HDOD domain-containing protein [Desulfovibrio sp.]